MNKTNLNTIVVVGVVLLLILIAAGYLFGGGGYGGWGMMGPGMMGGWGFSPFGWIGMLFMWLVPVGFLVLTALGVAWIVRAIAGGPNPSAPAQACPSCGRGVQPDWRNCPHCGTALGK